MRTHRRNAHVSFIQVDNWNVTTFPANHPWPRPNASALADPSKWLPSKSLPSGRSVIDPREEVTLRG